MPKRKDSLPESSPLPHELLAVARKLSGKQNQQASQAQLRRAVSTAYYAVFHFLCDQCANLLAGSEPAARSDEAWTQVYRALEHNVCKDRCTNEKMIARFPREIQDFAYQFVILQYKRHDADYNPSAKYTYADVTEQVKMAEASIDLFMTSPRRDRTAFCIFVLLQNKAVDRADDLRKHMRRREGAAQKLAHSN